MSPFLKRSFHWLGSILSIAGIIFVVIKLNDYSSQVDSSQFNKFTWFILIGFSAIYGVANIILAVAWSNLLDYFGATTKKLWVLKTYGLTQLAKYVPGNIMHLASRQAMGLAKGVPGWTLAKSSIWEVCLISLAGSCFIVLVLPIYLQAYSITTYLLIYVFLVLCLILALRNIFDKYIARAFTLYIAFLSISGMIFVGLLVLLGGIVLSSISAVVLVFGAFIIAWLIGMLTPGAPAGLGVREFILLFILNGVISETDLLLTILLSRVVTVSGDIFYFLLAVALSKYHQTS